MSGKRIKMRIQPNHGAAVAIGNSATAKQFDQQLDFLETVGLAEGVVVFLQAEDDTRDGMLTSEEDAIDSWENQLTKVNGDRAANNKVVEQVGPRQNAIQAKCDAEKAKLQAKIEELDTKCKNDKAAVATEGDLAKQANIDLKREADGLSDTIKAEKAAMHTMKLAKENKEFGCAYRLSMEEGRDLFELRDESEVKERVKTEEDRAHGRAIIQALVVARFNDHPDHHPAPPKKPSPIKVNFTQVGRSSAAQLRRIICQILRLTKTYRIKAPVATVLERYRREDLASDRKRAADPSSPAPYESLRDSPLIKRRKVFHFSEDEKHYGEVGEGSVGEEKHKDDEEKHKDDEEEKQN